MTKPRLPLALAALAIALAACAGDPPAVPQGDDSEQGPSSGPISVLEDARTVADDVEQRQADLEAQLNDPFSEG